MASVGWNRKRTSACMVCGEWEEVRALNCTCKANFSSRHHHHHHQDHHCSSSSSSSSSVTHRVPDRAGVVLDAKLRTAGFWHKKKRIVLVLRRRLGAEAVIRSPVQPGRNTAGRQKKCDNQPARQEGVHTGRQTDGHISPVWPRMQRGCARGRTLGSLIRHRECAAHRRASWQ